MIQPRASSAAGATGARASSSPGEAAAWGRLEAELDAWQATGHIVTLWWRDDDATAPTPALERLLDLTGRRAIPLTLAIIPRDATHALAERIRSAAHITVSQHGWAHLNHAPVDHKKSELGADRAVDAVVAALERGADRLDGLFGPARRWLTPPWNRIAPTVAGALDPARFAGVSAFGPRDRGAEGRCNTHVDPIDWRGRYGVPRSTLPVPMILDQLIGHLAGRRQGRFDPAEPTGLLTHHLDHDAALWRFLECLVDRLWNDVRVRWIAPTGAAHLAPAFACGTAT